MNYISERELIEKLRSGDQDAYRILFLRYYMRIYLFAKGFVKDGSLAEDIAQNVFMKLWIARANISGESINHLLYMITRNEVRDYFKSGYRRRRDSLDNKPEPVTKDVDALDLIQSQYIAQVVVQTIDHLSERRKEIFRLSREENLTNKEIAEMLGISVRTVEKSIELTLKEIRKVIPS